MASLKPKTPEYYVPNPQTPTAQTPEQASALAHLRSTYGGVAGTNMPAQAEPLSAFAAAVQNSQYAPKTYTQPEGYTTQDYSTHFSANSPATVGNASGAGVGKDGAGLNPTSTLPVLLITPQRLGIAFLARRLTQTLLAWEMRS